MPEVAPLLLIVLMLLGVGAVLILSGLWARARRCAACGHNNPDSAKFCSRCGEKLR